MTPPENTARLLQQWLQMTRAESRAIQTAAWPKLREIQSGKAALRPALDQAFGQWKSSRPSVPASASAENPFRAQVAQLIALEAHNAQILAGRREKARAQLLPLERAAQNLRNLRRSYAPPPPPAACNSYS
jgi:hypothetical protein